MKNSIVKYILVVSLLLNFSLLGAAGYVHYRQTHYRRALFGYGIPGRVPVGSPTQPYLFEVLSLKPEQLKIFQQKALRFHEALDKKSSTVDRLRGSLFNLARVDHPDSKAIEATIAEINGVQEDMQKMIVAHMLEFKSMLDRDQQKKFFDLIEGAMTRRQEIQCP